MTPAEPAPTQPAPGALLGSGDEADVFVLDELTPGGPVVIDWRNGTDGPAALDLARSVVIMAHVAVTPGTELAGVAHALLTAFLTRVGPVPADALDATIAHRAATPP